MSKYKSPGQKRKRIVRSVTFIVFIIMTYGASLVLGNINTQSIAWVNDHKEISATVTKLKEIEEEYRNLKGRKRYSTHYYLSYKFTVDNENYTNVVEVNNAVYSNSKKGNKVTVWYDNNDSSTSDLKINAQSDASSNNSVENMIGVAPYTIPVSLVLYWLLALVFVRESKKSLPTGFYTETSWLDIDDNYVVVLDGAEIVYFNIDKKQSAEIQSAYQKNVTLEELMILSKSSTFHRIPLKEITELSSDHNTDIIAITHDDTSHSIEFLNQTVKAHALERIKKLLPNSLDYSNKRKTRIQSIIPSTILLLTIITLFYFINIVLLSIFAGFICLVKIVPRMIVRFIDPAIVDTWIQPETKTKNSNEAIIPKNKAA